MSTSDILESLKHLSTPERLVVIEAASRLIREEMQSQKQPGHTERSRRMRDADLAVKELDEQDSELTEWTSLDAEEVVDNYLGG